MKSLQQMLPLIVLMIPSLLSAEALTENQGIWPELLGGLGATAIDPETVPLTWSRDHNIAWRTELVGLGQSSPVIWGGRLFVTSISGSMKESNHVTALDLGSGEVVWSAEIEASQPVRANYFQARAAPSPTVDAQGVYAFFETADLVAYSHDGEQLWHRSIAEDYGPFESNIGLAASTVQTEEAVIILVDHEGPSYIAAFDKKTGEERWRTDRDARKSYASPALVPVGDGHHIVASSSGSVDGYHPESGELLWSFDKVGGNRAAKPIAYKNGHFLVGASAGMHDVDLDIARSSNLSLSIVATAEGFEPQVDWHAEKAIPSFASPIVYRDCAYWVTKVGVVYCFDPQTGEQRFAERLSGGRNWAAPLGIGDRVYFFGKGGTTDVIAAGPEFRKLAENKLWEAEDVPAPRPPQSTEGGKGAAGAGDSQPAAEGQRAARTESGPRRGRDGKLLDDPTQYAVAAVSGSLVIRTGASVYCIRPAQEAASVAGN